MNLQDYKAWRKVGNNRFTLISIRKNMAEHSYTGKVTIAEAAKMTGRTVPAINSATKDGRLSYDIEDRNGKKNVKVVQVVDIDKLWGLKKLSGEQNNKKSAKSSNNMAMDVLQTKNDELYQKLERQYKEQIEQYKDENESLRQSLDKAQENVKRVTLLLEDKTGAIDPTTEKSDPIKDLLNVVQGLVQQTEKNSQELQKLNQSGFFSRFFKRV